MLQELTDKLEAMQLSRDLQSEQGDRIRSMWEEMQLHKLRADKLATELQAAMDEIKQKEGLQTELRTMKLIQEQNKTLIDKLDTQLSQSAVELQEAHDKMQSMRASSMADAETIAGLTQQLADEATQKTRLEVDAAHTKQRERKLQGDLAAAAVGGDTLQQLYEVMENLNMQIMQETERSVALAREVQALTNSIDTLNEEHAKEKEAWKEEVARSLLAYRWMPIAAVFHQVCGNIWCSECCMLDADACSFGADRARQAEGDRPCACTACKDCGRMEEQGSPQSIQCMASSVGGIQTA